MPLFSRKSRSKNNTNGHARGIKTVQLTCPECGFEQSEPTMAVSTYCRGCSAHFKILNGKAIPKKVRPSNPFTSLENKGVSPKLRGQPSNEPSDVEAAPAPRPRATPPTSALIRKAAANTGFFQNKAEPRQVACFECDHIHKAPAEASSTLCPACGAYIGLKDYDIRDNWNRRIQTRGNVVIQKKATVTGITIHCHNLTAHGNLTGGVNCSGDFVIQNHGKIMGKVRCKRLIIEKRARVEFSNPVHCEDAIIDGEVTGNFTCTGKLHLKKKATLTGDIKVATMAVDEGARHHGRMAIGQ